MKALIFLFLFAALQANPMPETESSELLNSLNDKSNEILLYYYDTMLSRLMQKKQRSSLPSPTPKIMDESESENKIIERFSKSQDSDSVSEEISILRNKNTSQLKNDEADKETPFSEPQKLLNLNYNFDAKSIKDFLLKYSEAKLKEFSSSKNQVKFLFARKDIENCIKNIFKDTRKSINAKFGVLNEIKVKKLIKAFPKNLTERILKQEKESFSLKMALNLIKKELDFQFQMLELKSKKQNKNFQKS